MKTLQNDLTTIEQSKRLLELGVPKNSANHYYGKDSKLHYIDGTIPYSLLWETGCTPCWSVGRLIEIFELCSGVLWQDTAQPSVKQPTLIERVIDTIVLFNKHCNMDFSKLED